MCEPFDFPNDSEDERGANEEEENTLAARDTWFGLANSTTHHLKVAKRQEDKKTKRQKDKKIKKIKRQKDTWFGLANSTTHHLKVETFNEYVREKQSGGIKMLFF